MNTYLSIYEIRKNNLIVLIESIYKGKKCALTKKLNIEDSYIYRLFTNKEKHRRNIGNDLAREIEKVSDVPENWLDQNVHH